MEGKRNMGAAEDSHVPDGMLFIMCIRNRTGALAMILFVKVVASAKPIE